MGSQGLYRLTNEAVINDPISANNGGICYTYDSAGNRLSRNSTLAGVPSASHSYDENDRLSSDAYDANGNTAASGSNAYTYDFEDRLLTANPGAIRFAYDGDGNRVSKTIGGISTKFLVDDRNPTEHAQVVEEIVNGSVQRVYSYGRFLISQRQLIDGFWKLSYYGYDGHGSVRFLTDDTGSITDTYDYDAFGNLIHSTGTTPNLYRYAGEQVEPALGLTYLRARYLNPATGRFLTMDLAQGTSSDPASLHKYLYTANNPVNFIDPSGNEEISLVTQTEAVALGEQIAAFNSDLLVFAEAEGIALNLSEAVGIEGAEDAVLTLTGLSQAEETFIGVLIGTYVSVGGISVATAIKGGTEEEERDILFGQKRADPIFSFDSSVPPDLKGKELKGVAEGLSFGARAERLKLLIWDHDGNLISLNTRGRAVYALAGMKPRKKELLFVEPSARQRKRLTEINAYGDSLPARRVTITGNREEHLATCIYGVSIDSGEIPCPRCR